MRMSSYLSWLACLFGVLLGSTVRAEPVRFQSDVMAVLSKAGCNQGTCHGNFNGKNGFRLSLRSEDPEFDLASLTRDMFGRRTDPHRPSESLLLRKATGSLPHEGGKRFDVTSAEYAILSQWIAAGMPADPPGTPRLLRLSVSPVHQVMVEPVDRVRLTVTATFSDGSTRDVTRLAVYEPSNVEAMVSADAEVRRGSDRAGLAECSILVRYLDRQATVQVAFVPERPGYQWAAVPEASTIDRHVFAKLRQLRVLPSGRAADSVFLRRVYLDVLGLLPTPDETRAFLQDQRPDKRARLIDRLLDRPEFAEFWALKWSDLLRNEEKTLDRKGVQAYHRWIRDSIAEGKPLNEFAREVIAARGSTYGQPAANYYRALRDPYARAEATAQVFLGIRMQCAKCHNHPFDRWTQNDYHSLAAFFARVQYRVVENNKRDRLDRHEFDGEQIVWFDRESELLHPKTGENLRPLFLGADTPPLGADADRLQALADWVARPNNPFFARTQANRVWHHLMGRGIVDPNDDFRASNPPVNAPLLDALAKELVAHRFDLRHLVRTILNSSTYQLSATPNETNRDEEANFSHTLIRPLQAEVLLDAVAQVAGVPVRFNGYALGTRAGQLPGVRAFRDRDMPPTDGERFLKVFGKPDRLLTCECERSTDTTLNQAFQLITGEMLNQLLAEKDNRIGKLLAAGRSDGEIIEELYLTALSRRPTDKERQSALNFIDKRKDRRAALEDLVWGLVNAKEFLLRQ